MAFVAFVAGSVASSLLSGQPCQQAETLPMQVEIPSNPQVTSLQLADAQWMDHGARRRKRHKDVQYPIRGMASLLLRLR